MNRTPPDIESARALVANAALWPHVRAFLWDFAPLIHPSHLSQVKAVGTDAAPRLKKYILSAHDVEPCFHGFPADDGSRLLLLGAETFDALAKWLGALARVPALRRVTRREEVAALKEALGDAYPAVFGYEAYFRSFPAAADAPGTAPAPEEILSDGYAQLASLLAPLPPPLLLRLRLRLPDGAPWPEDGSALPSPPLSLSKVLLLLKLRFPEAYALCSS